LLMDKVHESKNALSEFMDLVHEPKNALSEFMDLSDTNYKFMDLKMHFHSWVKSIFGHRTPKPGILDHSTLKTVHF